MYQIQNRRKRKNNFINNRCHSECFPPVNVITLLESQFTLKI